MFFLKRELHEKGREFAAKSFRVGLQEVAPWREEFVIEALGDEIRMVIDVDIDA